MKFLYAQQQTKINETVYNILRYHGHIVDVVTNGDAALAFALAEKYDTLILDTDLPGKGGLDILKSLRAIGNLTPALILSDESVSWQKCNATTRYIEKPFAIGEFLAHIRTICNIKEDLFPSTLRFGNITLNIHTYILSDGEKNILLPKMESRLLELLIIQNESYISTQNILLRVWGENTQIDIGIVWVYISYLRKKLASISKTVKIKGKRNIGYMLCIEE